MRTPAAALRQDVRPVLDGVPVAAGPEYPGVASHLIHAWKDDGRRDVITVLAAVLADSIGILMADLPGDEPIAVVPVPSSRHAVRRRGEDVVHGLGRAAVQVIMRNDRRACTVVKALHHRVTVRDQAGLGVGERQRNVAGAFVARGPLPRARIIVVDDVITTGATAAEAVRSLTCRGLSVLGVATVSHTPRRDSNSTKGGCRAPTLLV